MGGVLEIQDACTVDGVLEIQYIYVYSGCSVGYSGKHQDVCTVVLVCWTSTMCVQWVESPSHA